MAENKRDTWLSKLKRTICAVLPVSDERQGRCIQCGACCRLPMRCPFLREQKDGRMRCAIYLIRPPNCRKYPRSESEFITAGTCGYIFRR